MKKILRDKRAKIFEVILVLTVLIACSYAIFFFVSEKNAKDAKVIAPLELSEFYLDEEEFSLYAYEAAKIASIEAYKKIIENSEFASSNSIFHSSYPEYIEFNLNSQFSDIFKNKFESEFFNLISKYPKDEFKNINFNFEINIEENKIILSSEPINRKQKLNFDIEHEFDASFELSILDIGLNLDFPNILEKADNCKTATDLLTCMDILNFDAGVRKENSEYFFDLKTEKSFIFQNADKELKRIEIKFYL